MEAPLRLLHRLDVPDVLRLQSVAHSTIQTAEI